MLYVCALEIFAVAFNAYAVEDDINLLFWTIISF
jgi:hypothetical protein